MYKDIEYSLYGGVPKKYKQIRNKVFKDWEIPPWDLVIDSNHLIGEGKYGKVIQYMLRNDPKDRLSALEIIHQFQYIKQQVSNENKYYFSCLCC